MKGWKETYTDIVLDEEYGFKEKKLVKDLEKAIDKTGDLIKKIPDEYEDSNAYQELAQGQNALEYGIGILPGDFENYLDENKKPVKEKLKGYQSSYRSVSKYDGKEFDRKLEIRTLDKMDKLLKEVDKLHENLQYPYVVQTVSKIWDHIANAHIGIMEYKSSINDGDYDGVIDKDD